MYIAQNHSTMLNKSVSRATDSGECSRAIHDDPLVLQTVWTPIRLDQMSDLIKIKTV